MLPVVERLRRLFSGSRWAKLEGGDHWDDVGPMQFHFLLKEGLKPGHYLLDVGCGSFRGGRFFIEYLMEGHYFGIDSSASNIEAGIRYVLRPAGLLAKKPKIYVIELGAERRDFGAILGRTAFDFVWVHALFDHIPPEVIRRSLLDLAEVMGSGGRLYATIFLNPHGPNFLEPMIRPRNGKLERAIVTFPDREHWHHTLEFFQEISSKSGKLQLDALLYDYPHPLGLRVLRFVRG